MASYKQAEIRHMMSRFFSHCQLSHQFIYHQHHIDYGTHIYGEEEMVYITTTQTNKHQLHIKTTTQTNKHQVHMKTTKNTAHCNLPGGPFQVNTFMWIIVRENWIITG